MPHGGMGTHQHTSNDSDEWLTPPEVIAPLGGFDLDPCAAPEPRPWPTAQEHYVRAQDGLMLPWYGRIWLNPPYGGPAIVGPWMKKMAAHRCGIMLIFARTETRLFAETVWNAASAVFFFSGRLFFHRPDGVKAAANAGAPSCLVAYGITDVNVLRSYSLPGHFVFLRY